MLLAILLLTLIYPFSHQSPLTDAVSDGNYKVAQHLLAEKSSNLEELDENGNTALNIAIFNSNLPIVRDLLLYQANANYRPPSASPPIAIAAFNGNREIVKLLIGFNAVINYEDSDGFSPVLIAATNGHSKVVQLLLEHRAEVDRCTNRGNTALIMAARGAYPAVINLLIQHGANVNRANKDGNTPILSLVSRADVPFAWFRESVKLLVEARADLNVKNFNGHNIIHLLKLNPHYEMMVPHLPGCSDDSMAPGQGNFDPDEAMFDTMYILEYISALPDCT